MSSDQQPREDCKHDSQKPSSGFSALALVATACVACVAYEPDPLVPAIELRELIGRSEAPLSGEPPSSLVGTESWFPIAEDIDLSDGLTLEEANTIALFYAPALVSERRRHQVAAAQLLQAGLLPNPELFVGPRWSTDGLIFPASLMFEIPLGGELSAEEDAARAELDGAAWRVMEAELGVLEEVRLLFLRIQALREQRAQQEVLRVEAQRIVEWVEQLSSAGEVDVLTLQLARMEREDVIASIQRYDIELTRATTELLGMIGLHPMASVEPTTTVSLLTAVELPEADADRVLRHPRMKVQELEYMKADGLLRLEVARQYPNPRIGPDLEYDRGDLQLGLGLILPIPLFDQNEGQIAEAVAMRQAAREHYQATLLELASEEAAARRARDASVEYLRIHREGPVVNATQAEQALADRLRSGYANVLEVLGARRAISRVRVREVELRLEVAEATLRAAVAGGFVITEDISAETEVEK